MAGQIGIFIFITLFLSSVHAQNVDAIQDEASNNLIHPGGYISCEIGELGEVKKYGRSSQIIILVTGLGFGTESYEEFINHFKKRFTVYVITPAGFSETQAPSMPENTTSYSELSWTNGVVTGIINLIDKEKIKNPLIIAHFVTATQVALNLELNHADKIGKVIIMGGSPYRYYAGQKDGQWNDWVNENKLTSAKRIELAEYYWAPQWFKTVTKKTWDANMWTPDDYCKDNILGSRLFKISANVPIQVMIRYTIEWMAYDINEKYNEIKNPTLILIPEFKELLTNSDNTDKESCAAVESKQYLKYFHQVAWQPAKDSNNPLIQIQNVPDSRIFMWYDNPKIVFEYIDNFIK